MTEVAAALIGAVATAIIGVLILSYRNIISYSIVGIGGRVGLDDKNLTTATELSNKRIWSERVVFSNLGFRDLTNVELHIPMHYEPLFVDVSDASYISEASITTEWKADVLRVKIQTLPKKASVTIDTICSATHQTPYREIKGTGGKYKLMRESHLLIKRSGQFTAILFVLWLVSTTLGLIPTVLTQLGAR